MCIRDRFNGLKSKTLASLNDQLVSAVTAICVPTAIARTGHLESDHDEQPRPP